ncbi:MAG: hypothetical protein FWD72_05895, partial [Eggerthellaceae bacterium]|nr:hypothetical protein [Eggerthellaceae bacterium]
MDNREGPLGWEERNGEVFMQCAIVVGALVPLSLLLAAVAGVSAYVLVPCIGRGLDSQQVQDAIWAIMAAVAFPFVPVLAHGVVTAFRERTVTIVWARLCLKTLGGRYPVLLLLSAVGVAAEAAAWNAF